jgi:hypothetical protein
MMENSLKTRTSKPVVGGVAFHPKPFVQDIKYSDTIRLFLDSVVNKGWTIRTIKQAERRLIDAGAERNLVQQLKLTWSLFKLYVACHREHATYAEFLFKNIFYLENQVDYKDAQDLCIQQTMRGSLSRMGGTFMDRNPFVKYLATVPMELWIPLTFAPLLEYKKENKTETLCWVPLNISDSKLNEFRVLVKAFLEKYAPQKVYVPPGLAAMKVGPTKYNDGGEVRHDSEKPQNSWNSGFLFQEFMTEPLTPREVWLPGKLLKTNNSWWFSFVSQIMARVPYYANNFSEKLDLWYNVHDKLNGLLMFFDISGFGLQYPRELLRTIVEEIVDMYPDKEVQDHGATALNYLGEVVLEMDGKYKYPTRGIGLGYYETIKTIGIMAILDQYNPISIFGDQGIIPRTKDHPRKVLMDFGMLFSRADKVWMGQCDDGSPALLAGCAMSPSHFSVRRQVWSVIAGAFKKEFHWERKQTLQGLVLDEEYNYMWKYIAFHYELIFGYEFYPGESMNHPDNLGVNPFATRMTGYLRDWKVSKLSSPSCTWESDIFRVVPYAKPVQHGDAKKFSLLRKKVYKGTDLKDSLMVEYIYPKIEMNAKRPPLMSPEARSTPFWMDWRSFLLANLTSGKIAWGLSPEDVDYAIVHQKYADDPNRAKATGGYKIVTATYWPRGVDSEWQVFSEVFNRADRKETRYAYKHGVTVSGQPPSRMMWEEDTEEAMIKNLAPKTAMALFLEAQAELEEERNNTLTLTSAEYTEEIADDVLDLQEDLLVEDNQEEIDVGMFEFLVDEVVMEGEDPQDPIDPFGGEEEYYEEIADLFIDESALTEYPSTHDGRVGDWIV